MKKSPIAVVAERFGSKAELVARVAEIADRREGESDEALRARLGSVSNAKLVRIWTSAERVKSEFGSKAALVDSICARKFPGKGNEVYKARISRFTPSRLLDLLNTLD